MAELDDIKEAVQKSCELWSRGQAGDALRLLDDLIAEAEQEKRPIQVNILATQASTIAHSIGDLDSAKRYTDKVLSHEPDNAFAHFKVAEILVEQGKNEEARRFAERSYALASAADTEDAHLLLELIAKKWPEI